MIRDSLLIGFTYNKIDYVSGSNFFVIAFVAELH